MTLAFQTQDETFEVPQTIPCPRCGIEMPASTVLKRIVRGSNERRCRDCVATESGSVGSNSRGAAYCYPWRGDFDLDTMQPLKANGEPYMPGVRLCGNADCCNRSHVVSHG